MAARLVLANASAEQLVRFLTAFGGFQIVGRVEINRIDFRERDELLEIDAVAGFGLEALELGLGEPDVPALGEFITPDQIVALDDHVADRAVIAVLDAGAALRVQQIKGNVLVSRSRMELDGDGDKAEGKKPGA
jgi:hypothetical protein